MPKRHLCNKRYRDDIGSTTNAVHYPQYDAFKYSKEHNILKMLYIHMILLINTENGPSYLGHFRDIDSNCFWVDSSSMNLS